MSKKMLKRSLALGALMAFVITGQAWAAEVNGVNGSYAGNGTETLIYNDGIGISGWRQEVSVENVEGMIFKGNGNGEHDLTVSTTEGKITLTNVGDISTNDSWTERWFFNALGGTIDVIADSVDIMTTKYGVLAQNNSDTNAGKIKIKTSGDFNMITGWEAISVRSMQGYDIASSVEVDAENITVSTYDWIAEYGDAYWHSAAVYVGSYEGSEVGNTLTLTAKEGTIDLSGGSAVVVKNGTSVDKATVDMNANSVVLTATEKGIESRNNSMVDIDANKTTITTTNSRGDAFGVYARNNADVTIDGNVNITATTTVEDASKDRWAVGVYSFTDNGLTDGNQINIGSSGKEVYIEANNAKGKAYGVMTYNDTSNLNTSPSKTVLTGGKVTINANTEDSRATGVMVGNDTVGSKKNLNTIVIDSPETIITASAKNDAGSSVGIQAISEGVVKINNGNVTISADKIISTRGTATTEINANNNDAYVVQLTGDIAFDYDGKTSGTPVDANVNINLANDKSFFTGKIGVTGDDIPDGYNKVNSMNIKVTNGAKWNLTGASIVNHAEFGKDSVLNLETGSDFTGDVYALNASGSGDNSLKVDQDAKLQIGGIKETTYNIATGFENYDAVEGWTEIADNALMEANKVIDQSNKTLQVEIKTKEAEQMATDTGISESTAGLVQSIIQNADSSAAKVEGSPEKAAVDFINNVVDKHGSNHAAVGNAINAATKMAEAGGNNATAANIVKNVTGVTNDRLSFNCGHSAPHKGGHGVGLFEEGSGADIWVEYVHGKDKVEDMPSTAGATSYEGQFNGFVMGVDFKKVNKFQSGVAFNYGEGDTNSVGGVARTHSDYDFWGIGYYGNIHNDDSNVIFDINYAKTDSDVTQNNSTTVFEASPETTTWTAGVKVEKLYQNENVQIVPYTGLRYMSIDSDDYSTKCGAFNYSMERQDIWLLPLGVSIRQEIANDNGWTVSPRVDLSYIWAFGDTNSNMEVKSPFSGVSQLGYDVMDDGSVLGLVGIEAHKGQWGFGVSYSYQKGDHSESKKWFIDANYSF